MFDNIMKIFKKLNKKDNKIINNSKDAAKERLHLVLMQDRANVSADFLELMKQEIIEVIKKYIDVDESAIDVRLTNKENADGTNGAPALYANIPIINIKNEARKVDAKQNKAEASKTNKKEEKEHKEEKQEGKQEEKKTENSNENIKENSKNNNQEENIKNDVKKEDKKENNENSEKEIDNNKKESEEHKNLAKKEEPKESKEKIKSEN